MRPCISGHDEDMVCVHCADYRFGHDDGRADERAAVVAYFKSELIKHNKASEQANLALDMDDQEEHDSLADACAHYARAISRGDHVPKGGAK